MASITLTIPTNVTQRVLTGFCAYNNYSATLPDGSANPETQTAFLKRKLMEYVKDSVKGYESQVAAKTAVVTAQASVDTDISIT